ncbi:MAG: hypothetical protein JKY52_02615, partial [Flavobacteriales bacterium]|nr:hypothetical protein [Flavobacteriales bacterium]
MTAMVFHDLGIGIQTQGHPFFNSNAGLQIKCNEFDNPVNFFDIPNITGDIGDPQGLCTDPLADSLALQRPAGNTFSHTCNSFEGDAFDVGNGFVYNHHTDIDTIFRPATPLCHSTVVDPFECDVTFDKSLGCPSNFTITGNPC